MILNRIEILNCVFTDGGAGKSIDLCIKARPPIKFVNPADQTELTFTPNLETVRKLMALLSAVEENLVADLPPEQGAYIALPKL